MQYYKQKKVLKTKSAINILKKSKIIERRKKMVEGYCVKCKKKQEIKDGKEVSMGGGRRAMKGKCPKCDTTMFRIMGKK